MRATEAPRAEPARVGPWALTASPLILLACFGLLVLFGCSEPSGRGLLEIRVKDHREAIGDFSKAKIIVDSVRLKVMKVYNNGKLVGRVPPG